MERFIHISDLHVRRHPDAEENRALGFLVQQVLRRYEGQAKPTVLLTGDMTDDGSEAQYKQVIALLAPLKKNGFRLLITPGNHDYGPAGNFYTDEAERRFDQMVLRDFLGHTAAPATFYPHIVEVDSVVYVGVDSVVANADAAFHFAAGEVGAPQREALLAKLGAYAREPERPRTIVTYFHHHPFDRKLVMKMDDADAVMKILSGRTDFLCFGHDHKSASWRDSFGIDWLLASGKTTEQNRRAQYYFSEVTIFGKEQHSVATVSFKR